MMHGTYNVKFMRIYIYNSKLFTKDNKMYLQEYEG